MMMMIIIIIIPVLHDGDSEHSPMKEKNRSSYVILPIFMFSHSRFSFRNLKDANSCTIS